MMNYSRKLTLDDLALIGCSYKRLKPIRKNGQAVLTHYKIVFEDIVIWAQVMEFPVIQFVVKFEVIVSEESKSEDEVMSAMLDKLDPLIKAKNAEILKAAKSGWRLDDSDERLIEQSHIVAKLSWNRMFGRLCILFVLGGIVFSIVFGIIPFIFLALAGIDGIFLSKSLEKKILCG